MKFKRNDIVWCVDPSNNDGHYCVWCIDPNNNGGRYTITYYHRPCKVVKVRKDEIRVEVLDENDHEVNGLEFWVDRKFFQRVKSKAKVV